VNDALHVSEMTGPGPLRHLPRHFLQGPVQEQRCGGVPGAKATGLVLGTLL
jgi:hypothetical protein